MDWASDKQIAQNISLSKSFDHIVSFYYISKEQVAKSGFNESFIPTSLPLNILIRRSSNDYIFGMGADTFLTEFAITNLYKLLNSNITKSNNIANSLLLIERKQLPWRFFINNPSIDDINQYIHNCGYSFKSDGWFTPTGGGLGAIGLSRNQWSKVSGLDERFTDWGVMIFN